MTKLNKTDCSSCGNDESITSDEAITRYLKDLSGWDIIEIGGTKKLEKIFQFKNFKQALNFTVMVGEIAEEEGHHPVLTTEWGKVKVTWWTHEINGLNKKDFSLAAKTDELFASS